MVGKTVGVLAKIKAVAPNYTISCHLLRHVLVRKKKMSVSLKNILDETVKIFYFIKF